MAHAVWKGGINFGLVHIPVSLFSAEEHGAEISFHLLDARDQARIRYVRVNEKTGREVAWEDIVRALEVEPGKHILLTDDELQSVRLKSTASIELESFVDPNAISLSMVESAYYLSPGKGAERGYVILRRALEDQQKVGVGKIVLRYKERIALIAPQDDSLLLIVLRFPEEIKSAAAAGVPVEQLQSVKTTSRELEVANTLIEQLTLPWDPSRYHNQYTEAVHELVMRKTKNKSSRISRVDKGPARRSAKVIDIAALLERSVRERRSGGEHRRRRA